MICKNCGNEITNERARFCAKCGSALNTEAAAPMMPDPPAAEAAAPAEMPGPVETETLLEVLEGRVQLSEDINMFLPGKYMDGFWVFTNKSMFFYLDVFEWGKDEEDEWDRRDLTKLEKEKIVVGAYYQEIHSIVTSKVIDCENYIYFYDRNWACAELSNKKQKKFIALMERQVPGLTFLNFGISQSIDDGDYHPNVSKADPRNPYGDCYNPAFSRTYVVAYTKGFRKNFNVMDDAINAAKRDGILSASFNLAVNGFGKTKPIPGVPVMFEGGWIDAFN